MSYTYTVIEEDNESWAIYESETNNLKFKFINDEHAQEHIKLALFESFYQGQLSINPNFDVKRLLFLDIDPDVTLVEAGEI